MDIAAQTRHNVIARHMLAAGERVVVAVSGGPDSLCLLHVLTQLRSELGIDLHVAHLNHGLRGAEADADAEFVRHLAAEWGIGATVESADVQAYRAANHLSLEQAARQVRYAFLRRVAASAGAQAIAIGHTADDQVETILMHWLRGAGLTGLRGMAPVEDRLGGVRLIRPLLDVSRRDVEAYCSANALQPRRDRTNEDEHIWRNRLRRRVLPVLEQVSPRLRETMLRTAQIMADEDEYLFEQVRALWPDIAVEKDGLVSFDLRTWQSQPAALQRRLVREAWAHVAAGYDDLSWLHVEQVRDLVGARRVGKSLSLPQGVRALCTYTTLNVVGPGSHAETQPDLPWLTVDSLAVALPGGAPLPGTSWLVEACVEPRQPAAAMTAPDLPLSEQFDADVIGRQLSLRTWRAGDRMQPLGMAGERKIHDIMIDLRIPKAQRSTLPLLVTPERILWLVGARRSDWGKVTAATQRLLRVSFRRWEGKDASAQPK
jgi:tRNA(Ile)-lysidine synthase